MGDEAFLTENIIQKNHFWEFFQPYTLFGLPQKSPPLFALLTKIIILITHSTKELTLRFIPCAASIGALPVFYCFASLLLKRKWSIIAAVWLFATNSRLLYYAQEFKPYSSDVLMFMIAVILAAKFDLSEVHSKKKLCLYAAAAILPAFSSIPAMFVIAAYAAFALLKSRGKINAGILTFSILFAGISLVYLKVIATPARVEFMSLDNSPQQYKKKNNLGRSLTLHSRTGFSAAAPARFPGVSRKFYLNSL